MQTHELETLRRGLRIADLQMRAADLQIQQNALREEQCKITGQ